MFFCLFNNDCGPLLSADNVLFAEIVQAKPVLLELKLPNTLGEALFNRAQHIWWPEEENL